MHTHKSSRLPPCHAERVRGKEGNFVRHAAIERIGQRNRIHASGARGTAIQETVVEFLPQVHGYTGFSKTHDSLASDHDEVGKRYHVTEVLVDVMQSLVERVCVGVTIQVEITPQAIYQALVIRVIKSQAAVRAASTIPEVHEIVARGTESAPSKVRQWTMIIRARKSRLVFLHDCRDLIDDLIVLTARQANSLARGRTFWTRHHLSDVLYQP
jgi:hypothetical protein